MLRRVLILVPVWLMFVGFAMGDLFAAGDRETKVRKDKADVEADDYWIYNDLPRGLAEAKKSGKPLLVVFRCIPCEACAKFDEQVVRRDATVRALMDQYVPVRIVHANGMDLTEFQFDFDMSFSAFLMNADRSIYGRFATKSQKEDESQDMTMEGFAKTLAAGLELHKRHDQVKASLAGKKATLMPVKAPEQFATLKGQYDDRIHYEADVVKSCIHCHQVREAERRTFREAGKPVPDRTLFAFPMPRTVGITMDATQAARIKSVDESSAAAAAGFKPGDDFVTLAGQPIISIADVQWVLHTADDDATLKAEVRRAGKMTPLSLALPEGWRRRQPISFRATTWDLRRMTTGGLVLEELSQDERTKRGLAADTLALRVKYVGQYKEHAAGKNAGFQKDDVLISANGMTHKLSETEFIAEALRTTKRGTKWPVKVLRGEKMVELQLPMQ